MTALAIVFAIGWIAFWLYWLLAATGAKAGTRPRRSRPPGLLVVVVVVALRAFKLGDLHVHSPVLQAIGLALFVGGLALAVWARVHLGRNWGMPMTRKQEPELVTSGPYRLVRHPIYSGILLAALGTALAIDGYWLIVFALMGAYFIYSARVEERILTSAFPSAYPGYTARTKMLIPYVL